ncbi:MAG: L,D-transpeptidase family protein [Sphingomonas sp.]|uniref:L,D-transpeptidase family protein n=1 Tax=Sphingomonas sp. TaxID=28214 RepID=UPI0025E2BF6D|nr:L,D-transpeptidase family protein [Sphingomonas sp.]MBX3564280.1 L,D-transpeptidase family protein [Sphingomonas sp.]
MRTGLFAAFLLATSALLPAAPAAAQSSASDTMLPASDALRPGEFVWYPHYQRASTAGPVSIVISIPQQRAFVYQDGQLIAVSTVSTGSAGRDTPTGEFTILQKKTFHRSNLYSNAPMPYMQRLTWDGIALHAGHLPGYPASHGCIRLPKEFARQLYDITEMGGQVSVVDEYIDDTPGNRFAEPAPLLTADASKLGGSSFDMVTMSGDPPRSRPASWVTGAAREIVQPIPPGSR